MPGTVRGLALAHQKFGKLPWKEVVLPAVKLAEEGFTVNAVLANAPQSRAGRSPKTTNAEFKPRLRQARRRRSGSGDTLVLKDLGRTLRLIAEKGPDAFYTGELAELIEGDEGRRRPDHEGRPGRVQGEGAQADHTAPTAATTSTARRRRVPAAWLAEMLNILENFDLKKHGRWSPETLHLMIEAMRAAYADRARHLGDPDFVNDPGPSDDEGVREEAGRRHRPEEGDAERTRPGHRARPKRATARRTSRSSTRTAWRSATPTRWRTVTAIAWSCAAPASSSTTR